MDEILEISLLLDFYGQLLTERQFEMIDLHYNNDLSLAEIAEQLKISRQGVYDGIRQAKHSLLQYEEKLGLVEKFISQQKSSREVLLVLKDIKTDTLCFEDKEKIRTAINNLTVIVENI
jgi:uncharacterized protein